jgi:tripartite-type tricarboxylate transporter receptor subunit TctC
MRGRILLLLAFCLATCAVQAETYPSKPIRAIVPFPAGSATDGMARLVSAHFEKVFGHGLIIENMPGATGMIASRATTRAAPDGYTIMFSTNSTHSANAYLYNNLGYDPIGDFTPLALLSRAPHAMVVRAEPRFTTFKEFVAAAQENPGKLNFGYGNTGSLAGGAMLNAYAKIKTTGVSYRGTPQAATDLLGGQIDFVVMDVSATQEHVRAGKLRTLAVTGLTRMEAFPEAPTMVELGFPDFVLFSWNGVHGPAGMPPEIVATLNKAIRDAVSSPEGKRFYAALGAEIGQMSAAEFGDFVKQELKRWDGIIAMTGLPKQ